jgi:hypothetical protein
MAANSGKLTQMHTKANNTKLNKGVQNNPEEVLKILRDKTLSTQDKAAKIEALSGIVQEGGTDGKE